MHIDTHQHGAVTVLKPDGPVTLEDAEQFGGQLSQRLTASRGRFVLDASKIAYVDSRALEVLSEAAEGLRQTGQTLKVSGANSTLRSVFDLTELDHLFEYFEDVGSAARSFL